AAARLRVGLRCLPRAGLALGRGCGAGGGRPWNLAGAWLGGESPPGAVGLVAEIGDPGDLLLAHQVGDLLDQPAVAALLDHERELGDDDRLLSAADGLDVGLRANLDGATAGRVRIADSLAPHDQAPAGEVR